MHAIGIAIFAAVLVFAGGVQAQEFRPAHADVSAARARLNDAHIHRLKAVLRLTPSQERHWPAVEAALRAIARQSTKAEGGFVGRLRRHYGALVRSEAHAVLAAALPLIRSLDERQRREGIAFVRSMGLPLPAGLPL